MIAYNKIWLNNINIRQEIEDALGASITTVQKEKIESLYPVGFYTPNYFIRVGLFILTIIIGCFSFGLLSLLFLDNIEHSVSGLCVFFGFVAYAALEFFVQSKHHYQSGVDDALMWISGICIVSGINFMGDISYEGNALLIFLLSAYYTLRFADILMSAICVVALLALLFFSYLHLGQVAKLTMPFVLLACSAAIYFTSKYAYKLDALKEYKLCAVIVQITSLLCMYAAVNYFVVREVSNSYFELNLKDGDTIPFGWLFWIFTFLIPVVYIVKGLMDKDAILLRVGMLLIVAIVFTVRNYHTILQAEILMVLSGILLIVVAYALTRYLKVPKHGFTADELPTNISPGFGNVEALVIAETFNTDSAEPDTRFGGGSFGGGGASGDF